MRMNLKIFMIVCILFALQPCKAFCNNENPVIPDTLNSEYYRNIEQTKGSSIELLTNAANAFYKEGSTGYAVAYLLKAKRLAPANTQINNNLSFLRSRIADSNRMELKGKKDTLLPDELSLSQKIVNKIILAASSDFWAILAAFFFVIAILGVSIYLFTSTSLLRKIGFFTALPALILSIFFVFFAFFNAKNSYSADTAVMIVQKSALLKQPDVNSDPATIPFHAGTEFSVISQNSDGWVKIKFNSQNEGWIKKENIEII